MNNVLTLPPLVSGKVFGVLRLVVEEVKIIKNTFVIENFNVVVSIQWWGEFLPVFIRPKVIEIENQRERCNQAENDYNEFVTYSIRTTLHLFRAYLQDCNTLELVVLEKERSFMIGSAFLPCLVNLLEDNNDFLTLPLVDCSGEIIGEILFYINITFNSNHLYAEYERDNISSLIKNNNKHEESKTCDEKKENVHETNQIRLQVDLTQILKESSNRNEGKPDFFKSSEFHSASQNPKAVSEKSSSLRGKIISNDEFISQLTNEKQNDTLCLTKCEGLPCIKTLSDSSKVISINLLQCKKNSISKKQPKPQKTRKITNSNVMKTVKSNQKLNSVSGTQKLKLKSIKQPISSKIKCNSVQTIDKPISWNDSCKSLNEIHPNISEKKIEIQEVPCKLVEISEFKNPKIPTKPNKSVVDYLLGCDMTKEEEEDALHNLKEMSPSPNFVKTITKFNSMSMVKNHDQFDANNEALPINTSKNKPHLKFDFNNQIERRYYEKFFGNNKESNEFDVAKSLSNKQCFTPREKHFVNYDNTSIAESHLTHSNQISCSVSNECIETISRSQDSYLNYQFSNPDTGLTNRNTCCKYYKRMNELDRIIESLNFFEEKVCLEGKETNKTNSVDYKKFTAL